MPSAATDEEDVENPPESPSVNSAAGSSPLVSSAPSDAQSYKPVIYEKPGTPPPVAPKPWHKAEGIPSVVGTIDPSSQRKYEGALARYNATEMYNSQQREQHQINAQTEQDLQRKHVASSRNPETGAVEPVRDAEGNIQYRPGKGPIKYDDQGRAIQTQYDESGPKVVALDKNADVGTHPDRPNELYRQNKHAPWDYLGTVQEGLQSKDSDIRTSAKDAQLAIDKQLHGEVAHDLSEEVANRALAVQGKVQDFTGKAMTLRTLNEQLANFEKDHPGVNETEGSFFTGGARPTQTAQALREQKSGIEKQISDLQSQGYSTLTDPKVVREFAKPEMDALHEARSWAGTWVAPKEPGDLDRMIGDRRAALIEQGSDLVGDPILSALEKRKTALGITPPASDGDREALKSDPLFGPIINEGDAIKSDREKASQALDQIQTDYTKRLQPLRDQLQQADSQIAPLQDQADKLRARLESFVQMRALIPSEDPEVHDRALMLRVSQITDLKTKAAAQTVLNALEPLEGELKSRRAEIQPVAEAHDALEAEATQRVAQERQQFEAGFSQREKDLQGKADTAQAVQAVRESQSALSLINSTLLYPSSPAFAQEISAAQAEADQKRKEADPWVQTFEPSNFVRGLYSGAAQTLGSGVKGLAEFSEKIMRGIYHAMPSAAMAAGVTGEERAEGARALADLILKVPGIMAPKVETSKENFGPDWYGFGSFLGGTGLAVGEAAVNPALLIPQFFGQGYHGQTETAQAYFDKKAAENPNVPRDLEAERATIEKAGVLGGSVNAVLAIPFGTYGKAVTSVFGSARANTIANVLKASYERGGVQAVAEDLRILQASIAKTAGQEAFKEVATKSLEQVIKEITQTPLQRIGSVLTESATGASIFGGVQAAQNLVTRTYNPKTGLFENVPTAAGQGALLSAFFGGIRQAGAAGRAKEAETDIRAAAARRVYPKEPGAPPSGLGDGGTGPEPSGGAPSPQAARTEIDSLAPSEIVKPEQVQVTQHALRGLVKIAQGQPMEALTAVEQSALESETPDGMSRVEIVKGKPVINDATLERVRQIAPVTAQLLPRSEEQQRQTALAAEEKVSKGESKGAPVSPTGEQPTFSVDVQDAGGKTTTREVQAPTEEAARSQVSATIKPGEGLIRDVTQVTSPAPAEASAYVAPEHFESHVLEQISKEAGRPLDEKETASVRNLVKVAAPAYERWSKAFETVNATLQSRGSAGVSYSPQTKGLNILLPDLARHVSLYENPKSGEALVRHEAAHAVTVASGAKVVQLFKSAPEALKLAMKEAYRAPGATDYNFAHELWAYALAGKVELAAGRKIKLSGKFLPEQANRDFIVKYKRAFAEVLRFTRDIEGYLRKRGVAEDVISQWKELEQLFVSKIREVDAGAEKASEKKAGNEQLPSNQAPAAGPRAPPPAVGPVEPQRSSAPVENPSDARPTEPTPKRAANPQENPQREAPANTGSELSAKLPTPKKEAESGVDRGDLEAGNSAVRKSEGLHGGTELSPEIKSQLAVRLNLPTGAVGHGSKVTGNDTTVNVAYVAQEAADARPSHDSQGRETKRYDQTLQPRDRSLASYRKQSQNIANTLDFSKVAFFPETKVPATTPELGAPIMTQLGDTISGNGREIGIKQAYEQGAAAKYKTDFIRNARAFGINPATVRDMKEPILKRVITDDLSKEDLIRFSQESNESAAMGSNAIEVAGRDATRLTPELLSLFDPNYALDAAKNKGFMTAYMRDVVKGGAANEGNLTGSELERRVRAAVFAYAYGTDAPGRAELERLAGDESDPGGKTITNALLTVAPIVARMKTDIATGDLFPLDISAAISRGAQDISEALRNKPVKQSTATALDDMRNQSGLLEANPLEKAVVNFFLDNRLNRGTIEQGLSNYVEAVFKLGNPKNAELFGERKVPTELEVFQRATSPGELKAQATLSEDTMQDFAKTLGLVNPGKFSEVPYITFADPKHGGNFSVPLGATLNEALALKNVKADQFAAKSREELPALRDKEKSITEEISERVQKEGATNEIQQRPTAPVGAHGLGSGSLGAETNKPGGQAIEGQTSAEVRPEVGSGQPAAQPEVVPTLRSGENQGDLLSTQQEDFALVGQEGTDFGAIQAKNEKAIRERAESAKGQMELFSQSIDKLPDRMQNSLRGLLAGDSVAIIGAGSGVAKEGVERLAVEAMRRIRADVGNTEQVEILDAAVKQELKAQETDDPLKELMALIDTDLLGSLYRKAEKETPGKFETGRPDLALGAEGASIRAAHQFHTDTFEAQTIEGWDKIANEHLADPKWTRDFSNGIVRRYLSGDNLTAWETRAAMRLIAADSHSLGTPAEKLDHAVRAFAYARLRSKAGAELGSGRDPFKTPEERGREFLSKTFFRLKPEVEAQIEAEPNPQKRQEKLDAAMTERIEKLEKAFSYLAGKGITVDDIFNGSWELHGKGKKLIESEMARFDVRQQQALKLAQTGTRSAADIAKSTGLSVADVERINDQFIDQLEKSLMAKVAGGLTLENIDLQGALFAQTPNTPNAAETPRTPEEIRAEVRRIIRGMGFVASKDLGKFKVQKRKRPKLFVPPKPSRHVGPAPSAEPVPIEQRKQAVLPTEAPVTPPNENAPVPYPEGQQPPYPGRVLGQTGLPLESESQLPAKSGPVDERTNRIFNPELPKPPNESAAVPYPEGQTAPYTGRVLGQTGLPLYQEMMIRKGADMGSMDDLIKIGRVGQSIDAKPFDMVYEAWINNIYSGVGTHVANLSGNTLSFAMDFTLQRGMESLLNVIYRDADSPTFGEFKYIAQGILPGLANGLKRATRAWDTESSVFSNDVMNEQAEILEALDKAGGVPPAIPGQTGRVIRIPVRALLFEDELFKSLIGQMEVGGQALRIAKAEGLSGEKLAARMNELVSTPGSKAWARAVEKAIYLTYQEPTGFTTVFRDQGKSVALGKMAAKAQSEGRLRTAKVLRGEEMVVRNLYRAAGFFFPVIRTTYNIFKIGISTANVLPSMTTIPYRFARAGFYSWKDGKPFVESYSKAQQISDLARQIIAWATFGTFWALTTGDEDDEKKPFLITGSMPFSLTKKGQRELNERAYGGTYIIRIGGRDGLYIPYGRIEPIATVLGTVVDTVTNIKKIKHGQGLADTGDALLGYFLAQAQAKTFLTGFGDLTKSIEGSTNFTDIPKKLLLQALVPNLIRQPLRALDEWVRENKTAPAIYQTLPVGSLAEKKINVYGRPVEKGGTPLGRIFLAAGIRPDAQLEKADRLLLNWNRTHPTEAWAPTTPQATYHDAKGETHPMTGPEQTKFFEVSGRRAADRLRGEITESQINRPTSDDIKRMKQIFDDAHEQTKKEMFPKNRVNQVRAAYEKAA